MQGRFGRDSGGRMSVLTGTKRGTLGMLAAVLAAALGSALAAGSKPRKRWSFTYDAEGWRSLDSHIERSHLKAKDDSWSLKLDVSFPEPASAFCPVYFDIDLVGDVVYHVYVPADAPAKVKTLLFLKEKDGLWFQHFREAPLERGRWNTVTVDISSRSPHLRPSGHHQVWGSVTAHRMSQMGVKFFCDEKYNGSLYLDRVIAYPRNLPSEPLRALNLRENKLTVGRHEKFEVSFQINRPISNPFDPKEIEVDATFEVPPDGRRVTIPAFYYQDFERDLVQGREVLTPVGAGMWKARFAPKSVGTYRYHLKATYTPPRRSSGTREQLITDKRSFRCIESDSRGFIGVSKKDPAYFEFDNGQWFYPIGHNVHSPSDDTPRAVRMQGRIKAEVLPDHGTFSYDRLFKKMAENGENFAEVWMCSWWLGIEWIAGWKHYNGLTRYNLHNAWKLDHLLDLAGKHDLYLQLVVENHGKASTWCDPEWEDNPYNQINGGFLRSPQEFFSNPIAKEIYRKKLRYIIARWGYASRVFGFVLWSEVDLVGDSYAFHSDDVTAAPKVQWHREMSAYLDKIDYWDHPVTTHVCTDYRRIKSSLVFIPGIDYITCDAYKLSTSTRLIDLIRRTADRPRYLAQALAQQGDRNARRKPILITEYGGSPFHATIAGLRADLHAGLWASYMTHSGGTPLLWWFQFIDADDLYWNFKALAAFHKGEDRRGEPDLFLCSDDSGRRSQVGLGVEEGATLTNREELGFLCLRNMRMAYVWVYSKPAMESMPRKGREHVYKNIRLVLKAMSAGTYRIEVWDCYKGIRVAAFERPAEGGRIEIPIPEFRNDVALKIKPTP